MMPVPASDISLAQPSTSSSAKIFEVGKSLLTTVSLDSSTLAHDSDHSRGHREHEISTSNTTTDDSSSFIAYRHEGMTTVDPQGNKRGRGRPKGSGKGKSKDPRETEVSERVIGPEMLQVHRKGPGRPRNSGPKQKAQAEAIARGEKPEKPQKRPVGRPRKEPTSGFTDRSIGSTAVTVPSHGLVSFCFCACSIYLQFRTNS